MTITQGAWNTGAHLHGSMKPTQWDYSRTSHQFFGVTGELHLQGRLHGRELTAWLLFSGFADHASLQTAVDSMASLAGTHASVVWADGADSKTFTNCTFNGFEPDEEPWLDASGVNGWQVLGHLKFRQIKQ